MIMGEAADLVLAAVAGVRQGEEVIGLCGGDLTLVFVPMDVTCLHYLGGQTTLGSGGLLSV
jgi:hypothetical protein